MIALLAEKSLAVVDFRTIRALLKFNIVFQMVVRALCRICVWLSLRYSGSLFAAVRTVGSSGFVFAAAFRAFYKVIL